MRETKFNVSRDVLKRTYNGFTFDSVLEMRFYRDVVCPAVESGDVVYYELQKPYDLQPKFTHDKKTVLPIKYIADFYIEKKDGRKVVIDTKGCADTVAKLKRKMFWYHFPDLEYHWICFSKIDGGWCDYDYVKKQRSLRKKAKREKEDMEKLKGDE